MQEFLHFHHQIVRHLVSGLMQQRKLQRRQQQSKKEIIQIKRIAIRQIAIINTNKSFHLDDCLV